MQSHIIGTNRTNPEIEKRLSEIEQMQNPIEIIDARIGLYNQYRQGDFMNNWFQEYRAIKFHPESGQPLNFDWLPVQEKVTSESHWKFKVDDSQCRLIIEFKAECDRWEVSDEEAKRIMTESICDGCPPEIEEDKIHRVIKSHPSYIGSASIELYDLVRRCPIIHTLDNIDYVLHTKGSTPHFGSPHGIGLFFQRATRI